MKKLLLFFLLSNILGFVSFSQDFSNKGKDFWVGYGNHVRMFNTGGAETMQIYLTTDETTTGTVSIASIAFSQTFTVFANQITVINIPRTAALLDEGLYNHGIHITALKPIIAYGFIYVNAISGATVFLPTNTLGKEYYSLNYRQLSNEANSYSYFFVEAVEPGSTIVEIKPSQTTKGGWPANVTQTVTLTQGQIYQVLSANDLTGSTIKSIASGTGGCKKIAVFCGSGKISTGCAVVGSTSTAVGSSDNLYQQMYPTSTWGKKYILVPSENKQAAVSPVINTNIFRIFRPDPSSIVTLNGAIVAPGSFVNNVYDFQSSQTNLVESNKGILVSQYFTSANSGGCPSGNANPHDPEMIYLNPIEQTVSDVTVNSMQPSSNTAITQHFINVVVRNAGTGISSFKIDGITPPASSFTVLPQDNNYAYTRIWKNGGSITTTDPNLSSGAHRLSCDSGFNAIAYGFGSAESYGYSAGTNLKDLFQQISVQSQFGIEASPSVCTNSPFRFRVSLPYCADSIQWNLSNLPGPPTPSNPKIIYSSCVPGPGGPDSTTVVNGKTLYWYSLPNIYTFSSSGTFPVTITTYNTGATQCGTSQDISFDLGVFDPPNAGFTNNQPGCLTEPVQFNDTTITVKPNYRWAWDFGDPGSGAANTSVLQNPIHIFSTSGPHTVTLVTTTTVGCFSSQASKIVNVPVLVNASISETTAVCQNAPSPNISFTITGGLPPYKIDYTLSANGGAAVAQTPIITSTLLNTLPVPTATAGTYTYNITSVENANAAFCTNPITGQTATVTVNPLPTATISGTTDVCQGTTAPLITFTGTNATAPYTFTYNINGGANQTVTTSTGNSVTVAVPTTTIGTYTYELISVQDGSSTACANTALGNAVVTVQATSTATISGNASVCQDATAPVITFTAANGNAPFTFEFNINGGVTQTLVTGATSNSATITVPMTATGTFVYNLTSVKNTGPTTCLTPITNQAATVVINPNPTATIVGSTIVCQNTGSQNITFTGAGGTAPYTFTYNINGGADQTVTTTTGSSVTVSVSSATVGIFVYTMTQVQDASANTQCIRTYSTGNTAAVQVQATSSATISGTASVCQDATAPVITFTAANGNAPFTFEYNINGGATQTIVTSAASNSASITVPMITTGTFVYNLTSVENTGPTTCLTPITNQAATVVINPNPTATIAGSTIVCQNTGSQNITFTGAGGTAPYTFTYNINGGANQTVTTTTGNSITVSVSSATVGTFVYTMTQVQDASANTQCIRTYSTGNTATVQVQATSTATISGTASVCEDATAPLITFTGANGIAPFTFTYNINGGATQTISTTAASNSVTLPVSMVLTGTFIYNLLSVKNTGPILCLTPITGASATVTIRPVPTATIAGTTTLCQNSVPPNITFTGANATAPYTFIYTINGGAAQTVSTTTGNSVAVSVPTTIAGTYVYALTQVQEPTGCNKNYTNTTATVIVKQLATATIATNAATVCQANTTAPLITFTALGGVAPYTFAYTLNGAPLTVTTTVGNSVTVAVPTGTPGTFTYNLVSVQESSVAACTNIQAGTATVTVLPKPIASFTTTGPFCEFKSVLVTPAFGISPTGSVTSWVWDYGDGTGPQIRTNGNPFTLTYPTAGVKVITFKTVSDNGCESDIFTPTPPVTIFSKPVAGFINPGACLADALAQFTDTSTVAGAGASIVFWEWDFGDGSPIFAGTGPSYQNPTHAYAFVGQKTVTLIVTTNSGCKDTTIQQFFINGEVTRAAFTTLNANNLCSNRPVQIRENSIVNVGGLIRTDIYWDYLGTPTVFDQDNTPTPNKIYTHNYPNLQIDKLYKVRYYAYSGFNGVCQKDTLIDVLVYASPVAQFLPVPDACLNGGPIVLNQGTASGGTAVYTGAGVTFAGGVYTFNPLAAGVTVGTNNGVIYTVTSPAGCDSAKVQQIKVLAPPFVNTFTTVGNLCHNNAITFQNTYTNGDGTVVKWIYNWNDGSPIQTVTNGANVTHTYTTTGSHTATLTLETGYGCRNIPFPVTFTVNALPAPSYTFSNSVCLPSADVVFTNTTPNVASNTYQWSFELPSTAPANTSTLTSPNHIYTTQGPFNTHLIATDIATGCVDSTAVIVINSSTIHPAPVLQFNNIPDVCLNNGTVSFAALAFEIPGTPAIPGGPGIFTSAIPGAISTNGLFNPLIAGVGNHVITYTWTSSFNCPTSITKTVNVLAAPVVNSFTTVGNLCHNNAITFQNTYTNGDGTVVKWIYNWNDGSPIQTVTNGANVTHTYTTTGSHTATLTLETGYGCRNIPFPVTFTVNALPAPSYTFSNSVCLPSADVVFTNTTPNVASNTYQWSFELPSTAPANTSTLTSPNHIYTTQGPFNTHLIATDIATGCVDSTAVIVINSSTIHPAPVLQFNNIPDVCLNNGTVSFAALAFEIPGTPAIPGGPGIFTSAIPGAISTNGLFNPLIAGVGNHVITYTWTSSFNCPTSITKTVNVLAAPVVNSFTILGTKCATNDIIFQNSVSQGAGTINTWVYNWGDATPNTVATNGNNVTHIYQTAGTYDATLTLITDGGCKSAPAFLLQVIVNPLPKPNFTFSDTACLPQAKVLFNNTTPNITDWAYNWNFDLPSTQGTDLSTQQQPLSHTYFTQAPHNVQLIATSPLTGCKDSTVKAINTIHPAPTASFNFNKASVCLAQNVTVIDNSTFADGGPLKWSWNFGESSSNQLGQSQPAYTYATVNTFNVKLTVTNSFGCVDDTVRPFRVYAYPTVNAGPDSYVLEGGTFPMAATASGNTLTYLWTSIPSPTYLSSNVILNPLAKPLVDITYTLSVTAEGGCAKADNVFIKVLKFPEIPNTFTPNNDGIHDFWEIKYLFTYQGNKVQVFTRTGQKVFESNGYAKPWDGNMNGKPLPFDTYYYIIEPGSGRKPITGYVTIVK